jgi:precorrin-4/cobalt-precorrin-4 C11-methyltransferase
MRKYLSLVVAIAVMATVVGVVVAQNAPKQGKFYIVGMGTAPDLITVRGERILKEADLFVVETEEEAGYWKDAIGDREVYTAPHAARIFYGVKPEDLEDADARAMCIKNAKLRQDAIDRISQAVHEGKTVAALCGGDAMMYGTTWYIEMLPADTPSEVVPGVGAFQAASAAVKMSPTFGYDTNSVVVTMADWPGRVDTNDKLMDLRTSMVVYTMHLDYPQFFKELKAHYPLETPVAVVGFAGDPEKQSVIHSTVGKFLDDVDYENLPLDMHMLLVGKFLKCGQARNDGIMGGMAYIKRVHGDGGK